MANKINWKDYNRTVTFLAGRKGYYAARRYGYLFKNDFDCLNELVETGKIEEHLDMVQKNASEYEEKIRESVLKNEIYTRLEGWTQSQYLYTQMEIARMDAERIWVYNVLDNDMNEVE